VGVYIYIFLTLALIGDEWSASRPNRLTPWEISPNTHLIEGWVGPRAGLDDVEKRKFLTLPELKLRPLGVVERVSSRHSDCDITALMFLFIAFELRGQF
jgi:hypothetical protein